MVEPDLVQDWPSDRAGADGKSLAASKEELCTFDEQNPDGGRAIGPSVA
jgi:hypothetical protein